MIRLFDILFAILGLLLLSPIFVLIVFVLFIDTGSPIFSQKRIGRNRVVFTVFKFRTMDARTEDVATHLVDPSLVTPLGKCLRRFKVDELPQLWNVLKGDMSLVGPRPCLTNQRDIIKEREKLGIFDALPGITGLAQIKNVDMSDPRRLSMTDKQMLESLSIYIYFRYIFLTLFGKGHGDHLNDIE